MGVGNAEPFEDALHAAILAPPPVQRVQHHIGRGLRQARDEVRACVDLDDVKSFAPQRGRAFTPGDERHVALGRPAALEDRDTGVCPARHTRLSFLPATVCRPCRVMRPSLGSADPHDFPL